MTHKLKLILAGVAGVALAIALTVALPAQTRPQPANAAQTSPSAPFDHSDCQYPDRWSNPVDGCDNSDPAVPECIKAADTQAGEQACIASFVQQHSELSGNTGQLPPATVNQCGDK